MEELVPIALFALIAAIVWTVYYSKTKRHARSLQVIDKMVDRGEPISDEIVRALGASPVSPHRDLKIGLILIALSLAFTFFGQMIPDEDEAAQIFLGIASFPFLVGLVYCGFWLFIKEKP